ncbi:F0F1 ATP synthase subunit gamma [Candidatus Woesebacteria bacterium]|nr:F0F1 ATP synthase subunit gamma [Candidatus Woesebacteria bacterium]
MQNSKTIDQDLDFLTDLRSLAVAYEDISIIKMQQTRNTILRARNYVGYLKNILESIQTAGSYIQTKNNVGKKKKPLATVVITSNTKFQGDITRRIFDFFSHKSEKPGDIFVIGKIGKEFMKEYDGKIQYTDFEVSDIDISMKDLQPFLQRLLQYKEINVYYAIFKNLINQEPTAIDIGNIDLLTPEETELLRREKNMPTFLFEPSVEEISTFVNDNSVALMLLQTVYETQLARFASRMKAMDLLIQRIDEDSTNIKLSQRRIRRQLENTKQLERLTGVSLW